MIVKGYGRKHEIGARSTLIDTRMQKMYSVQVKTHRESR